jgi:hypothetical protein
MLLVAGPSNALGGWLTSIEVLSLTSEDRQSGVRSLGLTSDDVIDGSEFLLQDGTGGDGARQSGGGS